MNNLALPRIDGDFKVVQLLYKSQPFLLTDNISSEHFIILQKFLCKKGIAFNTIRLNYYDVPILNDPNQDYEVLGMGQLSTDFDCKKAIFLGNSGRYDIGLDWEFVKAVEKANPDWNVIFLKY